MSDPGLPLSVRAGLAIDKAISFFAPGYGSGRIEARLRGAELQQRMYAAAKPTGDAGGWIPYDGDVNSLIRTSSIAVRARVRQLVRDFPYAKRAIKLRTSLIIGNGIRLQARMRKLDGTLDQEANSLLENTFASWAERADITGRMSFTDIQALAERQLFECGEYFFIKRYIHTANGKNPFRLQPIEADRLPFTGSSGIRHDAGCELVDGIEYKKDTGIPVAYHFQDDGYNRKTIRVPAEMVIHGYEVERPGQMRGISPIAASVLVAGNLHDLLQAELEAMRMASRYLAFVTGMSGPSFGAGVKGKDKKIEYLNHATIQYLPNGEDVKLAKIDRQAGTFEPYLNFNLRTFAVGCGLTFELLTGNYDKISYSNLRGIRLDLMATLRPIQRNHINWLCTPAALACFDAAMIVNPDILHHVRNIERNCFTWIPPGQDSVDSLRDIKACADEITLGLTSPQELCALKGRSLPEVLDEIAEAQKMAEERGVELGEINTSVKTNPSAVMEEDDANDDKDTTK
jgi:lambda family phage portal protein